MKIISIREFQLSASKYLDYLPVTLTKYNIPVATVIKYTTDVTKDVTTEKEETINPVKKETNNVDHMEETPKVKENNVDHNNVRQDVDHNDVDHKCARGGCLKRGTPNYLYKGKKIFICGEHITEVVNAHHPTPLDK